MKTAERIIGIAIVLVFIGTIVGAGVAVIFWTIPDNSQAESVESRGVLNIDNRTEVEPGVWSIELPFTLKNVSMDDNVYRIWLEPGQSGEVIVKMKEQGQGQVQVELATKIELR